MCLLSAVKQDYVSSHQVRAASFPLTLGWGKSLGSASETSSMPACCFSEPLRPDLQHAFARRGSAPMGRVLACIGPWAPAPVWSSATCMCVVLPAPCSSVRGLLTACPVTTAVYFTSVCTNWTLIARFLQLDQIRPQLWHSQARGEVPEPGTRHWCPGWIKTSSDPVPCPDSASLSNWWLHPGIWSLRGKDVCNYAVRDQSWLVRIIGLSVTVGIRKDSLRQSDVGGNISFSKATEVEIMQGRNGISQLYSSALQNISQLVEIYCWSDSQSAF